MPEGSTSMRVRLAEGGGPVGIWIWNARSGKIQHSFSHNNHSGTSIHDGGGFDIDGGSSDCIIRNCISSDNEGAGYLLCEFGSPLPYTNNKIENNTSKNDGLKNNYGAITISGAGKDYPVTNCIIQNNVIIVENRNTVDGIPAALYFNGSDFRSMTIRQNSFDARNGSRMLYIDTLFSKDQVVFRKNKFPAAQKEFTMFCNKCISADTIYWKQRLQAK